MSVPKILALVIPEILARPTYQVAKPDKFPVRQSEHLALPAGIPSDTAPGSKQ
jgi:hypothetical protein